MRDLLAKRSRRVIATILAACDREELSSDARSRIRKTVLDQLNGLSDLAGDLLDSLESGSVMNELWLEKMESLRDELLAAVTK